MINHVYIASEGQGNAEERCTAVHGSPQRVDNDFSDWTANTLQVSLELFTVLSSVSEVEQWTGERLETPCKTLWHCTHRTSKTPDTLGSNNHTVRILTQGNYSKEEKGLFKISTAALFVKSGKSNIASWTEKRLVSKKWTFKFCLVLLFRLSPMVPWINE